jgi:hypothetical protein
MQIKLKIIYHDLLQQGLETNQILGWISLYIETYLYLDILSKYIFINDIFV